MLAPGADADVDAATRPPVPGQARGELPPVVPTEERMVEYRKAIIPLAVVLLLSIPDLAGDFKDEGKNVDKAEIADVLHRVVGLWPDGNPPRAALRRVNEYLMSPHA